MIIDFILNIVFGIAEWIIGLLPSGSSLGNLDLSPYLASANIFIDMPFLLSVIAIFVEYELTVITIRLLLFIWSVIKP